MNKKNNNDIIAVAALGLGAYFLFFSGKSEAGSGSEGGSFTAPLMPILSGETAQNTIYKPEPGLAASKKILTLSGYNSLSSYIPILNSPGVQANPITKAFSSPSYGTAAAGQPYGQGVSPLSNPLRNVQTKKDQANAIRAAAGQPTYSWR
jgi:hypothetical protein